MDDKLEMLHNISVKENPDSCIVFCNTRNAVDEVKDYLRRSDFTAKKLHGGMDQVDRTRIMNEFRDGKFRYLVATDVAARGIDVDDISVVFNVDLPFENENYVHRIGRTGRKDKRGIAYSFYYGRESYIISDIEELVQTELIETNRVEESEIEDLKADFVSKMYSKRNVQNKKNAINNGILRLHINAGKKQKMRPTDIVGTLCNLNGMTKDDIGIINIQDISTYFEVLNGKGHSVIKQLKKKPLKGRVRRVSIADEQKAY
jgi:superfamily II DNA/RNA helicase